MATHTGCTARRGIDLTLALSLCAFLTLGCGAVRPPTPLPAALTVPPVPATLTLEPPAAPVQLPTLTPKFALPTVRLLFTGDINPGRCPAQIALAHNDFTLSYQAVAEVLRAADVTIGSLDGAISDLSPPSPCPQTMNLIGPSRTVEGLSFAGFDVITVATNHAKDCGALGWNCDERAFLDTLRHLAQAGIRPVGGGETLGGARTPVVVESQGIRFAFLGVTAVGAETWASEAGPGTAPLSDEAMESVAADITSARARAEVVVVLVQWGTEYAERPDAAQLRWAGQMMEAGAALVIGNHPHVIQPVEVFSNGVVAYALGNFVFDQGPWRTRQGVVFEAVFRGSTLESWRLRPIHIYSLHLPQWAEPAEAESILARVEVTSAELPPR